MTEGVDYGKMFRDKASTLFVGITPKDVILYFIIFAIIIFIIFLFQYNSIQREVRAGRCYKMNDSGSMLGTYNVTAKNNRNEDLYKVEYNLDARSYSLSCACKPGDSVNNFRNIKVFDIQQTPAAERTVEKSCQCEKPLLGVDNTVYYSGYPGVARYMRDGDSSFFDKAFT